MPAKAATSQKGTITAKMEINRPAIMVRSYTSRPVICAKAIIGVPRPPKATGAVLAISDSPAAASGEKPRPIIMAAVIATGGAKTSRPFEEAAQAKSDQ